MMRKAKRVAKKKDKKKKKKDISSSEEKSSSGSSESEGSESCHDDTLFDEPRRVRRLCDRRPGVLACQAIDSMKSHLLSSIA